MSQKFQAAVHHRDDVTFVKLSGVIDEDNELADLTDKIPRGTAVIDLGEVERINSCGVRDWVNWLSQIETNNTKVVLVECSPAIVAQINLVNNFTGAGIVKSFYVPYFCPECDEEKVLLVESADMGPPPHEPPVCRCDECDLVMDFDDMPDSYFAFLSNQKHLTPPDKINDVLHEFRPADPEKSKIRSRMGTTSLSGRGSVSSLPSVPSLPSIALPGSHPSGSMLSNPYAQAVRGSALGTNPGPAGPTGGPSIPTHRSGALVYVMIGVLVAAISVLGFLLFRG
jgi:anti-anti-sigma regulatory factor